MSSLRMMAIEDICQRGSVRDADVAMLRRALMRETEFKAADADSLFRIHESCRVQDPAWSELFVSVLTDYVVRELEPSGYLTAMHGGWLMARLSRNGRVTSKAELDLLLNVLDKARWAPESLVGFALAQVRGAVVSGDGPLRGGQDVPAGTITAIEVEFVRRTLLATSAEGMSDLTRIEVETVLDIDADVAANEHACELEGRVRWRELVGQVVANAAMSASGYVGPSRELGFRVNALLWPMPLDPPRAVQLVGREAQSILGSCRRLSTEEKALQRLERQRVEIITGEPARDIDGAWLAERIRVGEQRGRSFAEALAALNACGAILHPAIAELTQRAVRAA